MACVNVVAAATDAEAERLSTSVKQLFLGVISEKRRLLQPPVENMNEVWTEAESYAVNQMLTYSFIGSKATIANKLNSFIEQTGVDEIMATSHIYDHAARLESYRIFAESLKSNG